MKKGIIVLMLGILSIGGYAVYSSYHDQITFTRSFTLDHVDIEIVSGDTSLDGLLPGVSYDYPIVIENKGATSFIRVKEINACFDVQTDWYYHEGYYYYMEPVETNETIQFCDAIIIDDIDKSLEDSSFTWLLEVEAIQYDHFTEDFSLEDPWQGEEIQSFESGAIQ